jgi:two-component system, NtrC family, sensor kinase
LLRRWLREGVAIGAILIRRMEVRPFSEKQIELLQTFADQAVIAIENVRLFTELEAKNRDLTLAHAQVTETLEQQAATSEILGMISSSPTDLQPVFDVIAKNAFRLCGGAFAILYRYDGELMNVVADVQLSSEGSRVLRSLYPAPPRPDHIVGRTLVEGRLMHSHDIPNDREFPANQNAFMGTTAFRTTLAVPMRREGVVIGAITVARTQVQPYTEAEIELLKTFAEQAVIAIENVHLFKELATRTADLGRSVNELTALGEVSRAVSSTLDLETVLNTIVARAAQLSAANGGLIYEYNEARQEFDRIRGAHRLDKELGEVVRAAPIRLGEGVAGKAAALRAPVQVADVLDELTYDVARIRTVFERLGYRSLVAVPLLVEQRILGVLVVWRTEPGSFAPELVNLLQTFATQSVLAILNARLFRELEEKGGELEAASRHKSEFLADMSHELRTPLNAIIGFSEVLAEGMFGDINAKQTEYLGDIMESGQHLLSLINDILDLSKIEAGRMELEPADVDLPSAIENALILVRERASRRGITLGRTIDEGLGMIRADERKVKQVLLNLLSNALKFTPEGGRIDVRAGMSDDVAEISVSDTGVGIAPEDQEAVFEEFRQVGGAEKKAEGTGLGLALSRKFIELHGGRIWVKSQVGIGSTFTFTIPVRRGE